MIFTDTEKQIIEQKLNSKMKQCPHCRRLLTFHSEPFIIQSENPENQRYVLEASCSTCGYISYINLYTILGKEWVENRKNNTKPNNDVKNWN